MRSLLLAVLVVTGAGAAQIRLISVQDEIAMGREAQKDVKKQVPEVTDRQVNTYIVGVGRRLAARATGPKYPYSFSVANYREINAFALPGGPVWVHRGAIAAAANEAQLAGVLAHEIAHISQRHAADQITKQLVANGFIGLLGAVLGNDRSAQAAQMGARVLAGGYMLKFSRDDEREADTAGAAIMRRAGWDAREMIAFMETLRREQGRDPASLQVFLSSHPAPGERADRLRTTLKGGGTKDSAQFRQTRARLARMPPARSMKR
ncbi:MAG TPA: M48 family metalloprotease [Vicinamibacterales bacterium]|nr:M48 family metalloprotease [Vicinamibacterales bacterium]